MLNYINKKRYLIPRKNLITIDIFFYNLLKIYLKN